jgi:hypothetical protein
MTSDKPRGYFKYILAADCESSGIASGCDDPSYDPTTGKEYQSVSWGFIVLDGDTLKEVDRLYLEIKWNGDAEWDDRAEKVHGLSKEYLEENGISEEEAVAQIANLVIKYWGPDSPVCFLAHNANFDLCFLRRLTRRHQIEFKFGNRVIDTNGIAFATFGTYTSDEFFEAAGLPERTIHNSMEDIEMTVESVRRTKLVFNAGLG